MQLHDTGFDNNFMGIIPKTQTTKAKIYKRDYVILESTFTAREINILQSNRKYCQIMNLTRSDIPST